MARRTRRPRTRRARARAREVYATHVGAPRAEPVDVEAIIRELGIDLQKRPLDDGVCGMCMKSGERAAIVVDPRQQGAVRLRFTLAHELGHALLMEGDGYTVDGVVSRPRDPTSSLGTHADEVEANAFAAELLMPEPVVRRLADQQARLEDSEVRQMARKFKVSPVAMGVRLNALGYSVL